MLVNSGNKNGLYNHLKEDNGPIFHKSPSKNIEKAGTIQVPRDSCA